MTEPAPPSPVAPQAPEPDGDEQAAQASGWRARVDSVVQAITGNPIVRRVLEVMNAANEAGATLFAAALAFSTMFALIPLVLLLAGVLGWLVDDATERSALLSELVGYFPPFADLFESTLEGAIRQRGALSIVGVVGLLWGSSAFYASLDEVMRRIFPGGAARGEIARRVRGLLTILVVMTVVIGTVSLSGLWAFLDQVIGGLALWPYLVAALSLTLMIVVVLAVYRFVPTAPPTVKTALVPAIVAGIGIGLLTNLFTYVAPVLIGGLSGFGIIATIFGALIWLNFSYQILLYGAAWARVRRDDRTARRAALSG